MSIYVIVGAAFSQLISADLRTPTHDYRLCAPFPHAQSLYRLIELEHHFGVNGFRLLGGPWAATWGSNGIYSHQVK
jgi:hypothetical protein